MTSEPADEVDAYVRALSRVRDTVKRCLPEVDKLADLLRLYRSRALDKDGTIGDGLEHNFHGAGCLFIEAGGAEIDVDFFDGELEIFDPWRVRRFTMSVTNEDEPSGSLDEITDACRSLVSQGHLTEPRSGWFAIAR